MLTLVNVGEVLAGKYRVDRILGIGGMGMVVAATHLDLDQKVALKFMLPEALASESAVERFLREAKAAVRLRGEHVCRVLDVGRLETGAPYIVMELMEGQDLAQLIQQRGALEVRDAVSYLLQALEGVAEAHTNDIVHRDLKPGNLFITADNDGSALVKVLDFGISKSTLGGGGGTKTGDIMGTPAYMAPEQMASSKNVDGRADIWALGVILYQTVTGRTPFNADTLPALCMAVMNAPPPPLHLVRADLPRAFCDVVARCLEKRPEQRFADVAQLAFALAPFGWGDAMATAQRIHKVLRRSKPASAFGTVGANATAQSVGPALTTLRGSAAQVAPASKPKRTGVFLGLAGGVVVAAVAIVAMFAVTTGGTGDPKPAPASVPAATPPIPTSPPPPLTDPTPAVQPPESPAEAVAPISKPVTETRREPKPAPKPKACPRGFVLDPARGCVAPTKPDVAAAETVPALESKPKRIETKPVETEPQQPDWHRIQRDKVQKGN